MDIGNFSVSYISHVSFLFQSKSGTTILTDPLFADGFMWNGHLESYLSPPEISIDSIKNCDAIFITHIHGDHCDHEAIKRINDNTGAKIYAPDDVRESLKEFGVPADSLIHIDDGTEAKVNDVTLLPLAGYDNSADEKGRPNKFSVIISSGETSLFYSGDCHSVPPGLKGRNVDAIFIWPHHNDRNILNFHNDVNFKKFVMMHGDKFKPGEFLCNLDYSEQKVRLEKLIPGIEIIIPVPIKSL
ncbi:hypothetical protein GF312_05705 [Candidatus Poribacteria bacterium]|nr:hypothetical protein [Candidatus Poribacteria bacterium]